MKTLFFPFRLILDVASPVLVFIPVALIVLAVAVVIVAAALLTRTITAKKKKGGGPTKPSDDFSRDRTER